MTSSTSFIKKYPHNFLEVISILFLFMALVVVRMENKALFFRDYGITWEGAYRLSLGQVPFTEFGIPTGPVGFVIPAISFLLFDASWKVFECTQLLINGLILLVCYSILKKITNSIVEVITSLCAITFLFLIFLTSPWYNSTALLLMLLTIRLSLSLQKWTPLLSGCICAFTIFTKQDYGVLSFFSALYIYLLLGFKGKPKIQYIHSNIAQFLVGFSIPISLFLFFSNAHDFLYWFNYGGNYGRRGIPASIFLNPRLGLFFITAYFFIRSRDLYLGVACPIILASVVTAYSSGLVFTSYFDIFLYAGIATRILSEGKFPEITWRAKKFIGSVVFILMGFSLLPSLVMFTNMTLAVVKNTARESFSFSHKPLLGGLVEAPNELYFFRGTYAPIETYEGIISIQQYLQKNYKQPEQLKVLNLSELTPIYAQLGLTPLKGLPLWFHTSVSFPEREQVKLIEKLNAGYFDVIIYQETHEVNSPFYKQFYSFVKNSSVYMEPEFSNFLSPSGAFKSCGTRDCIDTNISVFVKLK